MGNIICENYKVASDAATGLEMALSTGCIAGEYAAAAGQRQPEADLPCHSLT